MHCPPRPPRLLSSPTSTVVAPTARITSMHAKRNSNLGSHRRVYLHLVDPLATAPLVAAPIQPSFSIFGAVTQPHPHMVSTIICHRAARFVFVVQDAFASLELALLKMHRWVCERHHTRVGTCECMRPTGGGGESRVGTRVFWMKGKGLHLLMKPGDGATLRRPPW